MTPLGRERKWFVHRAKDPRELETQLNVLQAEGYDILTVLDSSPSEGFLFIIIASKWIR